MAEYIEREAAVKSIEEVVSAMWVSYYQAQRRGLMKAITIVEDVPAADVVPVVRCKDCKHRQDDDFCGGRGWPEQLVPDNGFCNNGKRKDGEE